MQDTGKSKEKTDLVIIVPPAGPRNTNYPPYGALYVASALIAKGYRVKILNIDTDRLTNREAIGIISEMDPAYVGFSGIVAPSYNYIKDMSADVKKAFPGKIQILGGGLASAAETVLENTSIDIVVKGEGDVTAVELMEALSSGRDPDGVRGLVYRNGPRIVSTGIRPLILDLDALRYPAFDLIDMTRYMPDGARFIRSFTNRARDNRISGLCRRGKNRMITIMTSRGCFGRCTFCFRAYPGLRVHSMKYVFDYIEYCVKKFNAGFFTFADECFAPNKDRNWAFIDEFRKRRPGIVFRILGMRVDTVDEDILKAYREIGCWMIEYGFESGSQKMLNIIDKGVGVRHNRQAAEWTRKAGIFTMPTTVLGMPGETDKTVGETVEFLKSLKLDFKQYQWSYALPIPGSPLYDFARLSGVIENDDEYLSSLSGPVGQAGVFHVNLTDEPDSAVAGWEGKISGELDEDYFRRAYGAKNRFMTGILKTLCLIELHWRKNDLANVIIKKIRNRFSAPGPSAAGVRVKYRKKSMIKPEEFDREIMPDHIDKELSLKKVNLRLKERAAV
ncbi:MAG: radical SAM protein [Candidatus Omnitrophota bacterium]